MKPYAVFNSKSSAEAAQEFILRQEKATGNLPEVCVRWDFPRELEDDNWYVQLPYINYQVTPGEIRRDQKQSFPPAHVVELRKAYRNATRTLCALAGVPPVNKLADADYIATVGAAYAANPPAAAICADTILYTLQTLRLDDGRDAWDRI